jgi:hypothetical protein
MSEIYLAYKQTAMRPAHRPSGGRRRRELGRPPWLSSACCTSPSRARGGAPRRWRGELGQPPWSSTHRARARGEAAPLGDGGGSSASHHGRALAELALEARRRLPCFPVSGRAEAREGGGSSAGRHVRAFTELALEAASTVRPRVRPSGGSRCQHELGRSQWPRAPGDSCEPPASGRAMASPATRAVCKAARWVDLPWVKRIPAAHTTVPWPRGSPAVPHRRRRG